MTRDCGKNKPPAAAMIMAAGLGKRMQPLTASRPKPMVELDDKPLIDYTLQRLADLHISPIVANVHYLPDILEKHLNASEIADVVIADERDQLLDTGGGTMANLDILGRDPFFILNSDSLWIEEDVKNLKHMLDTWDGDKMDCLMLMASIDNSLGYSGNGDFDLGADSRPIIRAAGVKVPYVHSGCCLIDPKLFSGAPEGPFSLNLLWAKAAHAGRLFGVVLDGFWLHIGTPEALHEAEEKLKSLKRS